MKKPKMKGTKTSAMPKKGGGTGKARSGERSARAERLKDKKL